MVNGELSDACLFLTAPDEAVGSLPAGLAQSVV